MADSESDDLIHEARKAFQQCQDAEEDNRRVALEDIRFAREGIQWPDDIRKQREAEGRPCLTINKLPSFIRQVVNDARQNKPGIKVRPQDSGADPKTAEIMSGLIRNIEYTSNADIAYDTAVECAVTGGVGYIRVGLDYAYDDSFDMDISIMRVSNPFSVYGDPNSRQADSSDWDVAFVTDRLSAAQFKREYPGAEKHDFDDDAWSGVPEWLNDEGALVAEWWTREKIDEEVLLFEDIRNNQMVTYRVKDLEDEDVKLALEMGFLEFRDKRMTKSCKVTQRKMSGLEVLKTTDWVGRYIPIVPVYGDEFDIEGKRYFRSLIHNAVGAQQMFNYWRTASTELVALAPKVPFIGPKGFAASDIDRWNTANTKSHPFLEYDTDAVAKAGGNPPQRQPMDTGVAAGALQEALNASDDIKAIVGMYDASLGARSNETSGKAIMARQREGDISTFHFIDNMARAIRHTGRILIDLIPKVYDTPRVIRVMGEDGRQSQATINKEAPELDKKGQPVTTDGQPPADDMSNAVMAMHDLTVGKYDLTVTTGPSFTTRREEAAMQMTEMARAFPQSVPVLGKHLARNLDWPGADEIADELEALSKNQIPDEVKSKIEEGAKELQKTKEENQALKLDNTAEMQKTQVQAKLAQDKTAADMELQRFKAEAEAQLAQQKFEFEKQLALLKLQSERELALNKANTDREVSLTKVKNDRDVKVMSVDPDAKEVDGDAKSGVDQIMDGIGMVVQQVAEVNQSVEEVKAQQMAPVAIVRDNSGRAAGIRKGNVTMNVVRGPDGRAMGLQ